MLALVGLFLWVAVFMTYVTYRNKQQTARIKNIENQQKKYIDELLEIKRLIYVQREKTEEAQKEKRSLNTE